MQPANQPSPHQSIHPSNYPVNYTSFQPTNHFSSLDPSNQPYNSNLCTPRPSFQPSKYLISHPFTNLSIQSVSYLCVFNVFIHLSNQSDIHPSFSSNQPSIDAASHPSIKLVYVTKSASQLSFH